MRDKRVSLGDVAAFVNGVAFKPSDWSEEGRQIVRIQNLTNPSKTYNLTNREVKDDCIARNGDMLVSWSATLGVFHWYGDDACVNQHIFKVIPNERVVTRRYLYHALENSVEDMKGRTHGATMKHINRGEFLATPIFLPPLDEQKRIADILDKADALRQKRKQSIAKLDELLQSVFLDMFGDLKHCTMLPLADSMDAIIDYRGRSPEKTTQGVPLVTAKIVKDGRILPPTEFIAESNYDSWMRRGLPQVGDVLFTSEAPLGKVAQITDSRIALAQRIILLRGRDGLLDNTFLMHSLTSPLVRQQIESRATGSTVRGIRQKELRRVTLPIPDYDLQLSYVSFAKKLSVQRETNTASLRTVDTLFSSLQQKAFKGEL